MTGKYFYFEQDKHEYQHYHQHCSTWNIQLSFCLHNAYNIGMFAVIRHTYEIDKPKDEAPSSYFISAEWKHYVWIFEEEVDAMAYAITLLDDPLLKANEEYLAHAIESLKERKYWQTGRESVAIGEVFDAPDIIYGDDNEKSFH